MRITTVGELVTALLEYDQDFPIVKADPRSSGYFELSIIARMTFTIAPCGLKAGFNYYVDAHKQETDDKGTAFDAVVL